MSATKPTTPNGDGLLRMVRVDRIMPAADNLRADVGDVTELAASIKAIGVLEPLVVTWAPPAGDPQAQPVDSDEFLLVVGHRRLAATKLAGNVLVPAIIRQLDERGRVEAMLIENLQREDLTPLEEAEAYRRLTELGLGQIELAKRVGRSQAHVSKRLSLLKLPDTARTAIASGSLPLADALELVTFAGAPAVVGGALARLVEYEKRGGYRPPAGRIAQEVKQELEEAQTRETALEGLRATKVSILKTDQYGHPAGHPITLGKGWRSIPMTPAAHKKHGCHAAYVDGRGTVHYVCTTPANHLKDPTKAIAKAARQLTSTPGGDDAKRAKAAQAKAAETRERNKILRVALPIRRKLAARLITPKTRREALEFALRQLIQTTLDHAPEAAQIAAELLEVKNKDSSGTPRFTTYANAHARLEQLALALAIGLGEAPFVTLDKRSYFDEEFSSHAGRYFAFLKACGYKATPVELAQLKTSSWRPAFDGGGRASERARLRGIGRLHVATTGEEYSK